MTIRRCSLILPCRRLDDFPTHTVGDRAAELLAAWTGLWHPALLAATEALPGWHPADEPPDPSELDGELVVVPNVSREKMAGDWCERLATTTPRNPPAVEALPSREQTVAALLAAAQIDADAVSADVAADFYALGFAHLQVELLTRAMHYSSVLDTGQFTSATLAAASAAVAGDSAKAHEELARAFDLLADARNHVYSVDYYVIDVTLLAETTLGESLRAKLATGSPTSVLASGKLLEQLARDEPASLDALRQAIEAGTACVIGGTMDGSLSTLGSPESVLAELERGREAAATYLQREIEVFAQFNAGFSPLLPQVLKSAGFRGALHASFDGTRLPRPEQCKTRWGATEASSQNPDRGFTEIDALGTVPLDVGRIESWLRFAERVGDSIAHDHVATVLLAGWPGVTNDCYEDFLRIARFGTLLGKLITLDEYFRTTREPDEWTTFAPRLYPSQRQHAEYENPISSDVRTRQAEVRVAFEQSATGLVIVAGLKKLPLPPGEGWGKGELPQTKAPSPCPLPKGEGYESALDASQQACINAWNFPQTPLVGVDLLAEAGSDAAKAGVKLLAEAPGCGYATMATAGEINLGVPLADGRILRNERLELTVSETTGGIQSLRAHRDRNTRISQRLVYHDGRYGSNRDTQMVAERVEVARNDGLVGQITSHGKLVSAAGDELARFTQSVRLLRRVPVAIVDVELDPQWMPEGNMWQCYLASRVAWAGDALGYRRGAQWQARACDSEQIESPEWVEVDDGVGKVAVISLGLPLHRRASATWLDTLLIVAGENARRFQFAIAIDEPSPTQAMLGLLTTGRSHRAMLPSPESSPTGWFLHLGAKNVVITHIEPLDEPAKGVRVRLLETEGHDALTRLSCFRPLAAARTTDFRGSAAEVLSVNEGRAEIEIGAHEWIQIEAEFDS